MENTTIPNQAPITPTPVVQDGSNKKLVIYTVLLLLATVFWMWSLKYKGNETPVVQNEEVVATTSVSAVGTSEESDLQSEIDASLDSQSELELKGIDGEF